MNGDSRVAAEKGSESPIRSSGSGYIHPQMRSTHDPAVTFAEYNYYASKARVEEDEVFERERSAGGSGGILAVMFPSKSAKGHQVMTEDEKRGSVVAATVNLSKPERRAEISDEEWTNANRALRTATWGSVFYLITTDILGPFGLPYAFASMGWGPGVALFTVFAVLAGYSGYLLWLCFMGLDSYEYPIKSFGDLGFRLFGWPIRYLFNILQGLQLLLNVGVIVISNGEALSQAAKFKLCFAICCLVWALAGFFFGQVRTLQKFGWLANAAVWINIIVIGISMGAVATTKPNYLASDISAGAGLNGGISVTPINGVYPAVQHSAGLPDTGSFIGSLNGAMQAVFSYGGSMIFPEFMSEMKRPRDFLKGMWFAQLFIYIIYMFYGLFMYAYQGQYVINPSYLGVSKYSLQTAGNVFAMVSALIAAALYGNIGVKVLYNNVFVEMFKAPPLTTKTGKYLWIAMIPIYWAIAFCIAAGIPDFIGLTSLIAAVCILQFTYTFPPLLAVAYMIKKNALGAGDGFDPNTGMVIQQDSGIKRAMRGFLAYRWYMNVFNILYTLGAMALAGLGSYAAIENLIDVFDSGAANSFVCTSPLQGAT